jgi:hypothetical protein
MIQLESANGQPVFISPKEVGSIHPSGNEGFAVVMRRGPALFHWVVKGSTSEVYALIFPPAASRITIEEIALDVLGESEFAKLAATGPVTRDSFNAHMQALLFSATAP